MTISQHDPQPPRTFPLAEGHRLAVRPYPFGARGRELEWVVTREGLVVESGEAVDLNDARQQATRALERRRAIRVAMSGSRRAPGPSGSFSLKRLAGRDPQNGNGAGDLDALRIAATRLTGNAKRLELDGRLREAAAAYVVAAESWGRVERAHWQPESRESARLLADRYYRDARRLAAAATSNDPDRDPRRAEIDELRSAAERQGWTVERTGSGHWRFIPPDPTKKIVHTSSTPSDRNAIHAMRKDLRRSGLELGGARDPVARKTYEDRMREADALDVRAARKADEGFQVEADRLRADAVRIRREANRRARAGYYGKRDEDESPRRALRSRTGLSDREIDRLRESGLLKNARWNERDPARDRRIVKWTGARQSWLDRLQRREALWVIGTVLGDTGRRRVYAIEGPFQTRREASESAAVGSDLGIATSIVSVDPSMTKADVRARADAMLRARRSAGGRDPQRPTPRQREFISEKIRILRHEGYPADQAAVIAYRMAGVPPRPGDRSRSRARDPNEYFGPPPGSPEEFRSAYGYEAVPREEELSPSERRELDRELYAEARMELGPRTAARGRRGSALSEHARLHRERDPGHGREDEGRDWGNRAEAALAAAESDREVMRLSELLDSVTDPAQRSDLLRKIKEREDLVMRRYLGYRRAGAKQQRRATRGAQAVAPRAGGVVTVNVGDVVEFGRPTGEKTRARVITVAPKSIGVELLAPRGRGRGGAVGSRWRIPRDPRMVRVVTRGGARAQTAQTQRAATGRQAPVQRRPAARGRGATSSGVDVVTEVLRAEGLSDEQFDELIGAGDETHDGGQVPSAKSLRAMLRGKPRGEARWFLRAMIRQGRS